MILYGWIKLHRKIQEHWLFPQERAFTDYEAWIDLLMLVNHEDKQIRIGNEIIDVKRGQRITSIRQLCQRWKWSNTKVSNFLNLLKEENMIDVKSDTKKTVITIVNYEVYQGVDDIKATQELHYSDTQKTQKHTNNNYKKKKNEKETKINTKSFDEDSEYFQLALRLLSNIRENLPNFKEPNLQTWADEIRLLIERDKRTIEDINFLIDWCQKDRFWKTNILSPTKLREHFDRLLIQSSQSNFKNNVHDIQITRPKHWDKPKPLTEDELEQISKMEDDMPF